MPIAALGGAYGYDSLNQNTVYERGTVSASGTGSISNMSVEQYYTWSPQGQLVTEKLGGNPITTIYNSSAGALGQRFRTAGGIGRSSNDGYNANGNAATSTNAAGSGVAAVFDAWGRPVSYTVNQTANTFSYKQTETVQYDALGRVLGEYVNATFPGQGAGVSTQHTFAYDALTGQVIADTNALTVTTAAPQGTDPVRYVYGGNGALLVRESGIGGFTTPSTYEYALTDPTGTVLAITSSTGAVLERYVYDGLGNAQALQENGTPYALGQGFTNNNRSGNWQIQQQFSGSVFDTGTQLLTYLGSDLGWNILYHGQMYDGIPGTYGAGAQTFNPRQQSLLTPDLGAIQAGISAYDPTGGATGVDGFVDRNVGTVATGAAVGIGVMLGVASGGLGFVAAGAIGGLAGGGLGGFAAGYGSGQNGAALAESTGIGAAAGLAGGLTGGVICRIPTPFYPPHRVVIK